MLGLQLLINHFFNVYIAFDFYFWSMRIITALFRFPVGSFNYKCLLHGIFHDQGSMESDPIQFIRPNCHTLPNGKVGCKIYKYALTVVDVSSRYKEAYAMRDNSGAEAAAVLTRVFNRGPLTLPNLLQVDPGRELMGTFSWLLAKNNIQVRRGRVNNVYCVH